MNTTAPKLELENERYTVDEVLRHNPKNKEVERNFIVYFDSVFLARAKTAEAAGAICNSHASTHCIRFSLTLFRETLEKGFA